MKTNIKISILAAIAFASCSKKDDVVVAEEPLTAGSANFSKYVALGNSLTAGFSDGALFKAGQLGSWTNILNEQFKLVGGGNFNIPFMPDDNIGGIKYGTITIQDPRLYWTGSAPAPAGIPTSQLGDPAVGSRFNNMGVPGAKSFHLLAAGYGNIANFPAANPYFIRFASTPNARIIDDAMAQNPTFFSLWIGNNDVLSYALSGGTGTNQTGNFNPATYGGNDITDPQVFASVYDKLLNGTTTPVVTKGLTSDGAKGVISTIPYVTSIPFFTTVVPNAIPPFSPANASNAALLNQLFGAINQIAAAGSLPSRFVPLTVDDNDISTFEANNYLLISDETLVDLGPTITAALTPTLGAPTAAYVGGLYGKARHAKLGANRDYILLKTAGIIQPPPKGNNIRAGAPAPFNVIGVSNPLTDAEALTGSETTEIKVATDAYNVTIKSLAAAKGLALFDANVILAQVANGGISSNGYTVTNTYPTGGGFSLDGVHPSARGYALIANKVLEAINKTYGSNLKPVDITKYRAQYPRSF